MGFAGSGWRSFPLIARVLTVVWGPWVLLDLLLLFDVQMVALTRGIFGHFQLVCLLREQENLVAVTST